MHFPPNQRSCVLFFNIGAQAQFTRSNIDANEQNAVDICIRISDDVEFERDVSFSMILVPGVGNAGEPFISDFLLKYKRHS